MKRSNNVTSITTTTASNGAASSQAAPHRKNAAQRNQTDSPYQQRTTQTENPTQQLIKQAVDYLIEQLNAGHSDMLAAYLRTMARFHNYIFRQHPANRQSAPHGNPRSRIRQMEGVGPFCQEGREGHPDSRAGHRLPPQEGRNGAGSQKAKPSAS